MGLFVPMKNAKCGHKGEGIRFQLCGPKSGPSYLHEDKSKNRKVMCEKRGTYDF